MKSVFLVVIALSVFLFEVSIGDDGHNFVRDLIRKKSGKIFLQRSSKKALWPKKVAEEEGRDYSNDDEIKVT